MLDPARHFGLLAAFSTALALLGPLAGLGIGAQFALYGALHATALVLSLGARARLTRARRLLFVAIAAILAFGNARLGLLEWRSLSAVGGRYGPFVVVAACAALGALAYGVSINAVLARRRSMTTSSHPPTLAASSLAATSLGCAAATCASFAVSRASHAAGILWLVIPWWFAFSGALSYAGRPRA